MSASLVGSEMCIRDRPAVRAGWPLLCCATTPLVASSTASWTDQSRCRSSAYRAALPAMCSQ
eukprot:13164968-Alexandrium_andersonii.AAC.1